VLQRHSCCRITPTFGRGGGRMRSVFSRTDDALAFRGSVGKRVGTDGSWGR
jgi:hypothetical protein